MTHDEQLQLWLKGESVCPNEAGECCPDFSCCKPELLASLEVRQAFAKADEKARFGMLGMFLGAAIALASEKTGKEVYIAEGGTGNG